MLNSLQILRGLAAWWIVIHHIQRWFFMGKTEHYAWQISSKFGWVAIDVFFVLSGFVIALAAGKYHAQGGRFALNRIFRIIPAYWFFSILVVLSIGFYPSEFNLTAVEGGSFLKSLFFIPHENPNDLGFYPSLLVGRTLIYEMFFYAIFSMVLLTKLPKASLSCSLILVAVVLVFRSDTFLGWGSLPLLEFCIGIWLFEYWHVIKEKQKTIPVLFPVFLMSALLLASFFSDELLQSRFFLSGITVYLFVLLEPLFAMDFMVFQFLKELGDFSYSTYLSHLVIIGWFYSLFGNVDSILWNTISITGIFAMVYLVSKYAHQFKVNNSFLTRFKFSKPIKVIMPGSVS